VKGWELEDFVGDREHYQAKEWEYGALFGGQENFKVKEWKCEALLDIWNVDR
jgi:hypothetical protein